MNCAAAVGQAQPQTAEAPSIAALRSLAYTGFQDGGSVTLVNGRYESAPFGPGQNTRRSVVLVRDYRLVGDLDGDGQDEAVTLLGENTGGSGTFNYVAVVAWRGGQAVNVATAALGDRVQVRHGRIANRRIVLDLVRAGSQDAACCPGELVTRSWELDSRGRLFEAGPAQQTGRLTPSVLAGVEWTLRWWDFDESARSDVGITLAVTGDRLAGRSGCNRYNASITPGRVPGALTIGPAAGTRIACPELQMNAERRFLAQLAGVRTFSFLAGELVLTWNTDAALGTMIFDPRGSAPR